MRKILQERFGRYGIEHDTTLGPLPCIGAVYLAAGYLISEMFGCEIIFSKDSSPHVVPKNITEEEEDQIEPIKLLDNKTFRELKKFVEQLKKKIWLRNARH